MPNEFKVKNGLLVSGSANINASGSEVFTIDGTSGRLFQVDDSLSGSLFSVNTAAGLPVIEAFSDNTVRIGQFATLALFVSQSRVGIGKESSLNSNLDIFGSAIITGSLTVSSSVTITGSLSAPNITGSLLGTASFAVSASWAPSTGGGGTAGSSGTSGANGANGTAGSSGTSGITVAGSSGTSGANGANGTAGSSGTSGANGANGTAGSSGTSGANGANGTAGSSGTSGITGTSGTSGAGGNITILDDGVSQGTATHLNFTTNITATVTSGTASISATGGGGGTPGGADTNIQFNDAGTFSGSGNFTFTKATNTVQVQGSGSVLLRVTGSRGQLFRVIDSGSAGTTILATMSSGSRDVFIFTTSSLQITGSVHANIEADALHYGRIVATPTGTQNNYSPTGWNDADPAKATVININGTNSLKITGLAGGQAGRLAILKNASADRLIILEDSSSLSTATNIFDFRNPIFLLPNGSATLLYDGVDNVWQPIATSGGIGFGAFFDVYEDFLGAASTFTTTLTEVGRFAGIGAGTGAGGAVSSYLTASTTERPLGVYSISTGTTNTGRSNLGSLNPASVVPANGQAVFLCRMAVETLSDATNEYQIFAGFQDSVGSTNVTDGVYWEYRRGSSTAWQGATANNSTRTTTGAAGPTVNTNYIWLGIYINSTWSRATYFYSEDSRTWVIAGEITTNLPTAARTTGLGVAINKTAGTAIRSGSIDLMAYRYDLTRG